LRGAELGGAVEFGECFRIVVGGGEGAAELEVGFEAGGGGGDGLLERLSGGFGLAEDEAGDAEEVLGLRESRVEGDGAFEVGEGLVGVVGLGEECAEGDFERGVVGGAGEGFGELGFGFGGVVEGKEGIGVGEGFVGGEGGGVGAGEGLLEEREGVGVVVEGGLDVGEVEGGGGVGGIEGVGALELVEGGFEVLLGEEDPTKGSVGGGDVRGELDGLGEAAAGEVEVVGAGGGETGAHGAVGGGEGGFGGGGC